MSTKKRKNKKAVQPELVAFNASSQLENAVQLASKQDQVTWAVFGVFWPTNALLLVALFTTSNVLFRTTGITVSMVGFVLSIVWIIIQSRALAHLNFYEDLMHRIESKYIDTPSDCYLNGRNNNELFNAVSVGTFRVRFLIKAIGVVSATLWLLSFLFFYCSKII